MNVETTALPGVLLCTLKIHQDERGSLCEVYAANRYQEHGITYDFVQDNLTQSRRGVLRGLHFQHQHPQGKLLTVLSGCIYDVVVDIDPQSPTFMQYIAVELNAALHQQLWVPPGYAHGFYTLSETATVLYKCTAAYMPDDQYGIAWNDPQLGIVWPEKIPLLSQNDQQWPTLALWLDLTKAR